MGCGVKFLRILRSTLYKSSLSISITVLFAFDDNSPCLKLKETTFMLYSNIFTYIIVTIQFPLLIIVSTDVIYEFLIWKPNATYTLVKRTIQNQPLAQKILRILLYSLLFLIILSGIVLSFLIYLELLFLTDIVYLILIVSNIFFSIFNIIDT